MQYSRRPNPVGYLIQGTLLLWGAWETLSWLNSELFLVPVLLGLFAALSYLKAAIYILILIPKILVRGRLMRPTDRSGSAAWASLRDIRKMGLFKREGFLAGMHENELAFVDIES